MGDNARLSKQFLLLPLSDETLSDGMQILSVVHGGYGHSSGRDISSCTNAIVRAFILNGTVPDRAETFCQPDAKPFDLDFGQKMERGTV